MKTQNGCIFCRIISGDAPAQRIYEDDQIVCFMDAFPVTDGHTLIVTKQHFENLFEADIDALQAVIRASSRLAQAIRTVLQPAGLMVFQLNGAAAGQSVFHYHMHLMPRSGNEAMALHSRVPGSPARLAELAEKLSAALG